MSIIFRLYICRELEKIKSLSKEIYNFFDCFCTEIIKTKGLVLMKFHEYKTSLRYLFFTSFLTLSACLLRVFVIFTSFFFTTLPIEFVRRY